MAFANLPIHVAEAMNRSEAEWRAMSSNDPTARYAARERQYNRAMTRCAETLVERAKANAKEYRRIVENNDKITRSFYNYKEM